MKSVSSAQVNTAVQIGPHCVGYRQPALIIAEAGVNHDGSVTTALELVDAAVAAGADAVKFQVFRAEELATATARVASYQQTGGVATQRELLERLELSDADFARVAAHCRQRDIGFLATPFSVPDVDRLVKLGVPAIKIASGDLTNAPLQRRAVLTGLPLVLSTGASTAEEIVTAVERLRIWGAGTRTILLHCISGYPAPVEAANLRAICTLQRVTGVPCGFSDHTRSTDIAAWAVAAGACVLEKHFTLDRERPGPDHAMSLTPDELRTYVRQARAADAALGTGDLGMTDIEAEVRAVARKSVVAARPIPAGTALTGDMLTVKRPGGGIGPEWLETLSGRLATVDIAADTVLTWDMVR